VEGVGVEPTTHGFQDKQGTAYALKLKSIY